LAGAYERMMDFWRNLAADDISMAGSCKRYYSNETKGFWIEDGEPSLPLGPIFVDVA
jgi:hypothetical protein